MKLKMKRFKELSIILIILLCIVFLIFYNKKDSLIETSYKSFHENMTCENIKDVKILSNKIEYNLINENSKTNEKENETIKNDKYKYYTTNPNSVNLKEELLLLGINVTEEKDLLEQIYDVIDVLFVLIFIGMIVFALNKISMKGLFKVVKNEKTRFSDVCGLDELKKEMLYIIDVMKHKEKYEKMGIRPVKGIILEGDPGNGKTLFARALAGEANMNFIATKGADFESAIVAVGPYKVRALFKKARKLAPVIVFIDEFDGIGTKRNYSGSAIETENTRIVTAMLNELDGFEKRDGVLVIAATNDSKVLDKALIRAGRFDRKYLIDYPKEKDIEKYIDKYLKLELENDLSKKTLIEKLKGKSYSKIETIINEVSIITKSNNKEKISLSDIEKAIKITDEK